MVVAEYVVCRNFVIDDNFFRNTISQTTGQIITTNQSKGKTRKRDPLDGQKHPLAPGDVQERQT